MNCTIGVDEAGRGPVAGPVSVGVVWVPHDFNWALLPRIDDSKKLTERMRERAFTAACELAEQGILQYHVALITAEHIDTHGITHAVRTGITEGFTVLKPDSETTKVLLDGLLHAPAEFANQQTIIGGDASEQIIALASIMAKVTRDRYMVAVHEAHPHYNFTQHKGYGTKAHYEAIKEYGMCEEHRRSFLKRFI